MATVAQVLNSKPDQTVFTIAATASVFDAIKMMADKHIGAVVVTEGEEIVGIMTERDYARKVMLKGKSSKDTFVREIMTPSPISIGLHTTVDEAMRIITTNRIRHLPVVDRDRVVGILSIGDVVNWIIASQDQAIEHLENYIAGGYPR